MTTDISARITALELLVEQLVYERVMMTDSPDTAVRTAMGMLTQMASERPGVPHEAVGAIADVLAAVMLRLEQGDQHGDLPPMRWGE